MNHSSPGRCSCPSIHVDPCGGVHIHVCPPPKTCPQPQPPTGTCIPIVAGAKHKTSRKAKFAALAAGASVPSALATSTIHMARRFVAGKTPGTALERRAFPVFEQISRDLVACTVDAFDSLPEQQRDRIFVDSPGGNVDEPIREEELVAALQEEIVARAGQQVFGDPAAGTEERAGRIRLVPPFGEIPPSQVKIYRMNGIRTTHIVPLPALAELLPSELHQDCQPVIVNGQPQVVCQVRADNCPGGAFHGVACARVLDVAAGDSLTLEGVNYFSVEAKVRLENMDLGTPALDVEAHVWGDADTPVTELVNGQTVLITDARVHDRLTFRLPADLTPGKYQIRVIVPNITGDPVFGPFLNSDGEFIQVVPPATARYRVTAERILARRETSPQRLGSDEVGLQTLAFALFADGTFGDAQEERFKDMRDVAFDSGTSRDITRLVFTHDQPILGMAMSVAGFEIDSERAFNRLITSRLEFFTLLIKEQAKFIGSAITALGGAAALTKLGSLGYWLAGIGAAVTLAIDILVALWAPADPIIRDSYGFTVTDLDRLTSFAFPAADPATVQTEGPGEISVNVNKTIPPEKLPLQYRETREYVSRTEDSRYEITYRYNRIA